MTARWIVDPSISTFPDASGIVFSSVSCNILRSKGGAFFSTQLGSARATEPDYLTLPTPGVDYPFTLTMETPRNAFTRRLRFASVIRGNQTFGTPLINLVDPPDDTPRFIAESGVPKENALNNFAKKKRTIWDIARNKNSFSMFPATIPATQFSTISCDLFSEIQRHLLENAIDGGLTWSDLWTKSEVQGYFNERLSKFYLSTGVIQKQFSVSVSAGGSEYDYPTDLIQAKRLSFEENLSLYNGLVSFWKLEENGNSLRIDAIGTSPLTPIFEGALPYPEQVTGKINFGNKFTTTPTGIPPRNYLYDPNVNHFNPNLGDFSIGGWILLGPLGGGHFINKGADNDATIGVQGYDLNITSTRVQVVFGSDTNTTRIVGNFNIPLTLGIWYNVVVTFSRTTSFKCYVNGTELNLSSGSSNISVTPGGCNPTGFFVLGGVGGDNGTTFGACNGSLDAVGYWSRVLNRNEVSILYNNGTGRELFPGAHDGPYNVLPRQDPFSQDNGDPGWQNETGTPNIIIEEPRTPLSFQLAPTPSLSGSVEGIYVADPTAVGDACVPLPIPNFMTWGIKYGVMADMLNKEGEANDPERAKYCEARWDECIQLTHLLLGFNDQENEDHQ